MSSRVRTQAIVIGASAGAIQALSAVLPALPSDYAIPVLIVVHVAADGHELLPQLFQGKCRLEVKEGEDKEPIRPGVIYFAPSDYHLLVEVERNLSLSTDEPVFYSRPSIDALFESAADAYGESLVGVILTGANQDGAAGLRAVAAAGGIAVVEDPSAAFAATMPTAALEICSEAQVMSLDAIATYLVSLGSREQHA